MLIRPWGNHQVACHSGTMEEVGITLHEKVTVIKFYCCLRLLVVAYKVTVVLTKMYACFPYGKKFIPGLVIKLC